MNELNAYRLMQEGVSAFGITITEEQWNCFYRYMRLLQDWNNRMNLTSITDDAAIITKHFVDSLTVAPYIANAATSLDTKTLCDIGTGAGFPGIPLKILFPSLQIYLVDAQKKRLLFLEEVIRSLSLTKIDTIHMRAEDFGRDPKYRNIIDFSTARAVAPMNVLLELCTPPLKTGGLFFALKGGRDDGEFACASAKLSCVLKGTDRFKINTADGVALEYAEAERIIYTFEKTSPTTAAFPRKAGIPSKKPL